MVPCITIGDSIAVGVGQARPECEIVARVGISSGRYVSTLLPPGRTSAGVAVISLGVNDGDTTDTLDNLRIVRGRISAGTVVWLLPGLKEPVREMIRTVAEENGDRTLDTRPEVGRDHLHPTGSGYQRIAASALGGDAGVEVAYAPDEPGVGTGARPRHGRVLSAGRHLHAGRHGSAGKHEVAGKHGHAGVRVTGGAAAPAGVARHSARVAAVKAACVTQHCRPRALRG